MSCTQCWMRIKVDTSLKEYKNHMLTEKRIHMTKSGKNSCPTSQLKKRQLKCVHTSARPPLACVSASLHVVLSRVLQF